MKKIIIIEPGSSALYIANAVKDLGYEPVVLCSISEYSGAQKECLLKNGYFEVDASKVENIIKCIKENKITDILGIISTADRFIYQACQTAIQLGVKGMDPALLKLNNKAEVIKFIPNDSPPSIIFNKNNIPYDALMKMLSTAEALVIKPSMSAGAKGLFEIKTHKDVEDILDSMKKEKQVKVLDQDWVAQPVVKGTLYSLEGYVIDGEVNYIGVSRRTRIQYTETQNEFPLDENVYPDLISSLKKVLEKLVMASHYQNGYFHSELIHDGQNALLIDANFGRAGGGTIAAQIALSSNKTLENIYGHVINVTFFGNTKENRSFYPTDKIKTLGIMYGVHNAEILKKIRLPDSLKSNHVQFADAGKTLKPVGRDNRSWIGQLIGLPEDVKKEIDSISIVTEKNVLKPVF